MAPAGGPVLHLLNFMHSYVKAISREIKIDLLTIL